MRTEGIQAEGEGENPSNSAGDQMKVLRFVAWFVGFLVLEKLKLDKSNSAGGRMKAPRFVVWSSRIQALSEGVRAEGEEAKCSSLPVNPTSP